MRVQAAWRCRVGAQALGVAKSSAVALQSALRGKNGREAARRRDEAAALARAPSASASELASESDDGYGDDDFDEFSPAKTTGPPSPAQRRAPTVPPVPLDPSSSDDGYGDSDFDDFDDE